jgi:hypothetical protein
VLSTEYRDVGACEKGLGVGGQARKRQAFDEGADGEVERWRSRFSVPSTECRDIGACEEEL